MTEQFGFWVACVVLIAVVAGGCEETNTDDPAIKAVGWDVTEIDLSDGTKCAVMDGYYSGGITCDWEANRVPQAE